MMHSCGAFALATPSVSLLLLLLLLLLIAQDLTEIVVNILTKIVLSSASFHDM